MASSSNFDNISEMPQIIDIFFKYHGSLFPEY